jgi:hypothetical protein
MDENKYNIMPLNNTFFLVVNESEDRWRVPLEMCALKCNTSAHGFISEIQ